MRGRPHKERLLHELNEIRAELAEEVNRFKPEEFDWAPGPDMKTCRKLLQEIGTMEKVCVHWLAAQSMLNWEETWDSLAGSGSDAPSVMQALEKVRAETLNYLNQCTEESLQTPVPLLEDWHGYFGGTTVEP